MVFLVQWFLKFRKVLSICHTYLKQENVFQSNDYVLISSVELWPKLLVLWKSRDWYCSCHMRSYSNNTSNFRDHQLIAKSLTPLFRNFCVIYVVVFGITFGLLSLNLSNRLVKICNFHHIQPAFGYRSEEWWVWELTVPLLPVFVIYTPMLGYMKFTKWCLPLPNLRYFRIRGNCYSWKILWGKTSNFSKCTVNYKEI